MKTSTPNLLYRLFWSIALAASVAWYLYFRVFTIVSNEPYTDKFHGNDFRHIYLGSWMLAHGQNPYDAKAFLDQAVKRGFVSPQGDVTINPYVYLPFTGLVLSPLTLLNPSQAMVAWFWINHILLWASVGLIFWSLRIKPSLPNLAIVAWMIALCFPFYRTLTAGQLNIALLFLFSLVYAFHRKGWNFASGAAAAFAFAFKIFPGILFLYFAWKDWAFPSHGPRRKITSLYWMIICSIILFAISFGFTGLRVHLDFLPLLRDMGYGKSTWSQFGMTFYRDPSNQSFNSFFHHIFSTTDVTTAWINLGPQVANLATIVVVLLLIAFSAYFLWRYVHFPARWIHDLDLSPVFGLFIILSLLIPSLYWDHYTVILIWPLMACFRYLEDSHKKSILPMMLCFFAAWGSFVDIQFGYKLIAVLKLIGLTVQPDKVFVLLLSWMAILTFIGLIPGFILLFKWRAGGVRSFVWALAVVMLFVRFPFSFQPFCHGPGLVFMSLVLWGTLILYGLSLRLMFVPLIDELKTQPIVTEAEL